MLRFYIASLTFGLWLAPTTAAQTWTPQNSGTAAELTGVHFLDATTGFAVGEGGVLLSTTDGGATWTARTLAADDLEGIDFNPSGTVGIIATDDGYVFRSVDGGATWVLGYTGAGDLRGVDWADDAVVWVAGRDGDSAVSTDGGQTWTYRSTGSSDRTEGVAAVSAQEAWVVNRSGEIRHTDNGGATWANQPSGTGDDLNDVQMLDAQTGYIAGGAGVLKTTNGGATWAAVYGGESEGLFFLDADTGWVVGEAGGIWFTDGGGSSWTLQPSGVGSALIDVHFPTTGVGWAVGEGGTIVKFAAPTTATEPGAAPGGFVLSEAQPNPFASATRLTLAVAEAQAVRVEVFDGLGRRVATLHDGVLDAGPHPLVFDATALPAGIYAVRATGAAGGLATRRLVVAR
ncbi:MAG TPA: YCF48-related protein [Acidimicrobiales bacterium]|nr:YCF48-related protein [Acidimicrobiales bacterium]